MALKQTYKPASASQVWCFMAALAHAAKDGVSREKYISELLAIVAFGSRA